VQDAEDGNAGLHQELPVAVEKTACVRCPFGFLKHQASLIVARNDIAQVIDRLPGERENPHVAERVLTQSRRQVVFCKNTAWLTPSMSDLRNPRKLSMCL
jgi:hypothetical protein